MSIDEIAKETIEQRFADLSRSLVTQMVHYPGMEISDRPLQSEKYANCNGVALFDNGFAALSHYDTKSRKPEDYLPEMAERIKYLANDDEISSVVIGGDPNHFFRCLAVLRKLRIPVIGSYLDSWQDGEKVPEEIQRKVKKGGKDIIAVPSFKEVLMYSYPVGYKRLTPEPKNKDYSHSN